MSTVGETVADIDGNVYHIVVIGTQVWMVENLQTTKYNDGTEIPLVTDDDVWYNLNAPGYCWYNNDEKANRNTHGALYNWHALHTGKLCPAGWHVPSDKEWAVLADYLGGDAIAGGKMKETGSIHWLSPNAGASNSSGFTALPSGFRGKTGFIAGNHGPDSIGLFWSDTAFDSIDGWTRYLLFDNSGLGRNNGGKYHGFSVRCLKD
jgi:uncharacterized protein (TIGR02145 family)